MRSQSSSQNPANALRAMAAVVSGHYGAERDRAAAIIPRKRFALWPLWSAATTMWSATGQLNDPAKALRAMSAAVSGHYGAERDRAAQ